MLAIVLLPVALGVLRASDQVNAAGCCDMEAIDPCAWNLTWNLTYHPWKSSYSNGRPNSTGYPGFDHSTEYYYLKDNAGGTINSTAPIEIETQYTIITLDYYFYTINPSLDSYLTIYFVPQSYPNRVLISDTNIPVGNWIRKDIPCNDKNNYCCGTLSNFPCLGTFEVVGSLGVSPPTGLMAIDNIGACVHPPPACCKFISSDTCDFINVVTNTVDWLWSGIAPGPVNPPPLSPTGAYVYYEVVNSSLGTIRDNTFRSDQSMIMPSTVTFVGGFYVETPYGNAGDSGLKIDFVNLDTGKRSEMAYFKTTYGLWESLSISCSSVDCCDGLSTCEGWLEFVAHVDYPGGTALYAIAFISETGIPCP